MNKFMFPFRTSAHPRHVRRRRITLALVEPGLSAQAGGCVPGTFAATLSTDACFLPENQVSDIDPHYNARGHRCVAELLVEPVADLL